MNERRIYICSPCSTEEQRARLAERITILCKRIEKKGWVPVWHDADDCLGDRLEDVTVCHGMLLDVGWRRCQTCIDEKAIAENHKLTFYHTAEEWKLVKGTYVI